MAKTEEALAAVAAPAKPRRGIWTTYFPDVSNNNGKVDYRTIARNAKSTGITCVEMKASEGTTFVDRYYHDARADCYRYGLRTFAYHYARPDVHPGITGARAEANHFCDVIGDVKPYDWRPMLDLEVTDNRRRYVAADWVIEWNRIVWKRTGVAPCIYSYWAYLIGMGLSRPLGAGLIFAFPNGQPQVSPCPRPWKHWHAHQYSWHGHVAGVRGEVDLNYCRNVWPLLADPVRGFLTEPLFKARRRAA